MPVHNVEDWVTESIDSVLSQTLRELELIVVDDHSTDETMKIVEDYRKVDSRVRIVRATGRGGASARNAGIEAARGEFLAFADGDDIVPSHAYERLLATLDVSGSEMAVGSHLVLEPQATRSRSANIPVYDVARQGLRIVDEPRFLRDRVCWNRLISRKAWTESGIAFVESPRSNDIVAMVQAYCAFAFDVIPDAVYCYRRRVGATSMSASKLHPRSTVAHLEQELRCEQTIQLLGDAAVLETYSAGILEHDLWAHGAHLLSGISDSNPDLVKARSLFQQIVQGAPESAFAGLPENRRLAYAFVRAGLWEFAAAASAPSDEAAVAVALRASTLADVVRSAHSLADNVNGVLTRIFRTYAAPLLDEDARRELSDAELVAKVGHLREAQSAGIPRNRLTPLELAFVRSPAEATASELRGTTAAAPVHESLGSQARHALARVRRRVRQLRGRMGGAVR